MNLRQQIRKFFDRFHQGYYIEKYILRDGKQHKVAIICPGGGYHWVCSFSEGMPYARKLNQMGYSAFVVHYRCGIGKEYPIPQEDLARAIRKIMSHAKKWNLDMEGYSLWGSSAGGHLAASMGTEGMGYKKYGLPKPGALILSYPVVTMGEHAHEGSRNYLLGNHPSFQQIEFASVEKQLTKDFIPTFVWCGLEDHTVDPKNSYMLRDALVDQNIPHCFLPIEDVDHGVGIGEGLACEGWFEKAVDFWENNRKISQQEKSYVQ